MMEGDGGGWRVPGVEGDGCGRWVVEGDGGPGLGWHLLNIARLRVKGGILLNVTWLTVMEGDGG